VLKEIQKPEVVKYCVPLIVNGDKDSFSVHYLETPKTSESLASLRKNIEKNIARQEALDAHTKLSIQKVANAAKNAFANQRFSWMKTLLLFEQNNEKTTRTLVKATVVGTTRVLSYKDIAEE
jgi:hypothetical protein